MSIVASCHPDRPNYRWRLCEACYDAKYGLPKCSRHPERRAIAKELCASCYHTKWQRTHPLAREHVNAYLRDWWKRHPEHQKRQTAKKRIRRNRERYGLEPTEFDALIAGGCGICGGKLEIKHNGYHIDHDHTTGATRGALCPMCNKGLGLFKDNATLLTQAIEYLNSSGSKVKSMQQNGGTK